jgi:hypothetical protein
MASQNLISKFVSLRSPKIKKHIIFNTTDKKDLIVNINNKFNEYVLVFKEIFNH